MEKRRKNNYPTKQTVNLAAQEVTLASPSRAIPIFIVAMIGIALFSKFFVSDQIVKASAVGGELAKQESQMEDLKSYTADYADVKAQYDLGTGQFLTDDEKQRADRMQVLTMLHEEVMPQSTLSNITITGNDCSIVISSVPLDRITEIVAKLESNPLVQFINVTTADTVDQKADANRKDVTANLKITLTAGTDAAANAGGADKSLTAGKTGGGAAGAAETGTSAASAETGATAGTQAGGGQ